jgi:hypothetical protein
MSGGGSGGGQQQSGGVVNTSQPWKGQEPYLTDIFKQAQSAQNQVKGQPSYTGDFVAGPTGTQQDTNQLAFNTGQQAFNIGSGVAGQGQDVLNKVLGIQVPQGLGQAGTPMTGMNRDFLSPEANPNLMPALEKNISMMANRARDDLFPQIGTGAWNGGAYGGTAHGTALARSARDVTDAAAAQTSNALSNIWNQAYTTERGIQAGQESQLANQQQSWNQLLAQLGPQLLGTGLATQGGGLQTMQGAGAVQQGWNQDMIQNALSKENYTLQRPFQNLNTYAGLIGGAIPGGGTQTQYTASPSTFGNFLGGALGGATLGGSVGGMAGYPMVGAGVGAGLGGLAGLFG